MMLFGALSQSTKENAPLNSILQLTFNSTFSIILLAVLAQYYMEVALTPADSTLEVEL